MLVYRGEYQTLHDLCLCCEQMRVVKLSIKECAYKINPCHTYTRDGSNIRAVSKFKREV
jgi:hypothetical protein